jgi:hypothetical protein
MTNFWVKRLNYFSSAFQKQNNYKFCEICAYKKRYDNKICSPISFVDVFGFGIRDLGWVKIRIRDPG